MRTIQKLSNVSIGATSLGKVEITKVGQAIAHIPEFKAYFDAEYYKAGALDILNMANGNALPLSAAANKIKDSKGFDCIQREYTVSAPSMAHTGDYDINAEAWTFFVVVDPVAEAEFNASRAFRLVRKIDINTDRAIHLVITNTANTVQHKKTSEPASDSIVSAIISGGLGNLSHPSLIVYSYSNGSGSVRVNGKEVDRKKVTQILNGLRAGEWDWFRNANGKYYAWGGFNLDLTAVENKQYLDDLELFYIKKYKIVI